MVGVAEIGVLSADRGASRGELGVNEGADERDHTAGRPGGVRQRANLSSTRHLGGVHENSAADDAAHYDHRRIEHSKATCQGDRTVTTSGRWRRGVRIWFVHMSAPTRRALRISSTASTRFASSKVPSLLAMTIVATPLPIRFTIARASDMNRSTPSTSASPSTGTVCVAASVLASTMKPDPVTPAAPFEVTINTASSASCWPSDMCTPNACAMKIDAIDR